MLWKAVKVTQPTVIYEFTFFHKTTHVAIFYLREDF